jgi:hypothetical protein
MYALSIASLMLIFPVGCAVLEAGALAGLLDPDILGKWFVFWAVGGRLLVAGVRQIVNPRYTAEVILGIRAPEAQLIVRELGFANTALGITGLGSLIRPGGLLFTAIAGAVFYGLAGVNHALHGPRGRLQTLAMVNDLVACVILAVFSVYGWRHF